MPVFTDTTPPPSLADLRRLFYGGGNEAEYAALLAAAELDRTAADMINPKAMWWQHSVNQVVANNVWTPIAWDTVRFDHDDLHNGYTAATTIAAGSNGAALPQGTINVASTTGFLSAGHLAVRISGKDTVVAYTGITSTTFTGCTLGSGTLATSQPIRQVQCSMFENGRLHSSIFEACFAANATGGRAVRIVDVTTGFPMAQAGPFAVPNEATHVQVTMQDGGSAVQPTRFEVKQTSGGALDVVVDGLQSPSLMRIPLGPYYP